MVTAPLSPAAGVASTRESGVASSWVDWAEAEEMVASDPVSPVSIASKTAIKGSARRAVGNLLSACQCRAGFSGGSNTDARHPSTGRGGHPPATVHRGGGREQVGMIGCGTGTRPRDYTGLDAPC